MTETIVALATPNSRSALGMIRVSGRIVLELCEKSCGLPSPTPRCAHLTKYTSLDQNILDQIIMVYYEEGRSFTGENCMELTCHGNPIVLEEILNDLIHRGCRMANPGEFSYRAFQNGKIDLSQAEAIADLIGAKNKQALFLANKNLDGNLSKKIDYLQDSILKQLSDIEAFIDFPEDDLGKENTKQIITNLQKICSELLRLIEVGKKTAIFNRKLKVVLVGPPNAGKSSIFNNIIGLDRAIIDQKPGTTRDFIDYNINLGKINIQLYDTAGIRETNEEIEIQGIERTYQLVKDADLVLLVLDRSLPYPSIIDHDIKNGIKDKKTILVLNKSDLQNKINITGSHLDEVSKTEVSVKNEGSMLNLTNQITNCLLEDSLVENEFNLSVNLRQSNALSNALVYIKNSIDIIMSEKAIEFAITDLKESISLLGEIVGNKDNEDMLDLLFSNFCIGK
ncbi:MAG: tRNA uridine-5-carboxymethylaminomethyl(34) synthesis GTPase MnmE [Verrucomicrobiota bacterium]|nr:tRNA uridine-5-carboxymethylaminomethyl(34) synthesis GTPase MnmE [Verrucomicrobiota bacterium]